MLRSTLKDNFGISKMKVYLAKCFLLNMNKAPSLLDLDKPQQPKFVTHFFFFSAKTTCLA